MTPDSVKDALFSAVKDLPAHLSKSLTWDHRTEMARHAALTHAAHFQRISPHAHFPWERGTNEDTNGLIANTSRKGQKYPATPIICDRSPTR
jgi:IS30 family transposase